MANVQKAVALFAEGFNCSQAILSAFSPSVGMTSDTALKVASGLGEGMATLGEACGAVTGALMVLGLTYGPTSAHDRAGKKLLYALVREFTKQFESRNGSILCRKLLGFDGEMPPELKLAVEMNIHQNVCPKFVRDAAEVLTGILYGQPKPPDSWDAEQPGGADTGGFLG
ncbi:MAG: C-GCAxxG-C-C family protein [Phycisphaerae bacterium]|nr:C-GCAxxG-C-C family protein [Phycisphaerae bacterium]